MQGPLNGHRRPLSPHFSYMDAVGVHHEVWYTDKQSIGARAELAASLGLGVGLWRLGNEDPGVWELPQLGGSVDPRGRLAHAGLVLSRLALALAALGVFGAGGPRGRRRGRFCPPRRWRAGQLRRSRPVQVFLLSSAPDSLHRPAPSHRRGGNGLSDLLRLRGFTTAR